MVNVLGESLDDVLHLLLILALDDLSVSNPEIALVCQSLRSNVLQISSCVIELVIVVGECFVDMLILQQILHFPVLHCRRVRALWS